MNRCTPRPIPPRWFGGGARFPFIRQTQRTRHAVSCRCPSRREARVVRRRRRHNSHIAGQPSFYTGRELGPGTRRSHKLLSSAACIYTQSRSRRRRRRRRPLPFLDTEKASAVGSRTADGTLAVADATAASAGRRSDSDDNTGSGDGNNSGPPVLTAYMTSDNDGDSVVASSGCSGCPSAAAPGAKTGRVAGASKGILVHNNKKSGNTNRVSFVTNSSATGPSLSPSPSVERPKKKYNRRPAADDSGDDAIQSPYHIRPIKRPTGFGVKSYLHEFYDDPDSRESFQGDSGGGGGGGGGDDDFKYFVEPETHWYRHCSGVYVVLGLTVMAVGAIALAAGHLIPAKDPVVGRSTHMEVIDRRAVSFNDHLASCRYIGSVVFAVGVVFTVVRFWASVIRGGGFGFGEDRAAKKLRAVEEERPSPAAAQRPQTVRIPITGTLENVQPDSTTIKLQFADSS